MFETIWELTKSLGGIFAVVFYVAIVLWTYKDARRRIDDPILVATSVATSMIPIFGVFVYMLLRPPEYVADVRERELEIRAMERRLGQNARCGYCRTAVEPDYLSCPVCMSKLRQSCRRCERPLDPRWKLCPYCETEAPRPTPDRSGPPGSRRAAREDRGRSDETRQSRRPRTRAAAPARQPTLK